MVFYIKLKFDGNRFTSSCCSHDVTLDVDDNTTKPKDLENNDEKMLNETSNEQGVDISEHGTINCN